MGALRPGYQVVEDLKGKRIATATGTTAHVFLDKALRANKIDPKEVELVNQTMPAAVTAFVSGAVPAVALRVPFNVVARDKVPGAVKLADASAYYPQAAIIGGWAAANSYYEPNQETLAKLIRGWAEANDYIVANPAEAMEKLQKNHYSQTPIADINGTSKRRRCSPPANGRSIIRTAPSPTGSSSRRISSWQMPGIKDFTPASKYFDPSLYLKTIA